MRKLLFTIIVLILGLFIVSIIISNYTYLAVKDKGGRIQGTTTKKFSYLKELTQARVRYATLKVEELLASQTVGEVFDEKLKFVTREQNQVQSLIIENLDKLDAKLNGMKYVNGPNYDAVIHLRQYRALSRKRTGDLEKLKGQVSGKASKTLEETIKALRDQDVMLDERLRYDERRNGVFGWIFRLIAEQAELTDK